MCRSQAHARDPRGRGAGGDIASSPDGDISSSSGGGVSSPGGDISSTLHPGMHAGLITIQGREDANGGLHRFFFIDI